MSIEACTQQFVTNLCNTQTKRPRTKGPQLTHTKTFEFEKLCLKTSVICHHFCNTKIDNKNNSATAK